MTIHRVHPGARAQAQHLEALLRRDGDLCRMASAALGSHEAAALLQQLDAMLASVDATCRVLADLACDAQSMRLDALVLQLESSDHKVRSAALIELGRADGLTHLLDPATLAQHAEAVVAMLDGPEWEVRSAALYMLRFLSLKRVSKPQHAHAVVAMLDFPGVGYPTRFPGFPRVGSPHPDSPDSPH